MPELPEVETIRLGLYRKIISLKIKKIELLSHKSFIGEPKKVEGKVVRDVWRRGKMLGIELGSDIPGPVSSQPQSMSSHSLRALIGAPRSLPPVTLLLFHLKMTGQIIFDDGKRFVGGHPTSDMRDQMPNSHTRIVFTFSNSSHLYFNDQRKFGWVRVVDRQQALGSSLFKNLGPEPLEKGFSWQILKTNLLKHKSMPVKVAIMDQAVVVGVGNIYANEACFDAKIDPRIKVRDLTDEQFKKLYKGVITSLKAGIKYGGATRAHFVDSEGHKGYFLDYAFVYGRDKHPCKICKTIIQKITLGGRGTYLCPKCQKQ